MVTLVARDCGLIFEAPFCGMGVLNETKTKHSFYSFKQSPGV